MAGDLMADDDIVTILAGLSAAVILVGGDRRIALYNKVATDWFGEDLNGRDIVRAIRHPDFIKAVDDVLAGAKHANAVIAMELPVRTTLKVSVTGLAAVNRFGARAVICCEDISHVFAARQMRSDFVANVSHELRSPLTALAGFIETLKGPARDDPEAQARFLDLMEGEAHRMNRLIDDLLSLTKVEANERVRPLENINVERMIRGVAHTLQQKAESEDREIRILVENPIPEIKGEPHELTQVFHNLIENALKYGKKATPVTVRLFSRDSAPGVTGKVISVAVSDQGEGIERHHIPRLTERFYRVDEGRSRSKGGTGLGLAIVSHIVNRHRGQLTIESTRGEGSIFTVTLPVSSSTGGML